MFQIRLFGQSQAKYYDRYLSGFPHQRASLLLCFLVLNRNYPQHRERLAATFWGDSSSQNARKQLRNALWSLRQTLQSVGAQPEEFLFADEEYISFLQTDQSWLDIDQFETPIQQYQAIPGHVLSAEQAEQLEAAVDLYIGDLLEGIYEDWCLFDRERLRLLYQTTLNKLLVYYAIHSAYGRALDFGQRLLTQDHTLEAVHRQVMCLHWLSGNSAAALSQYKLCCQVLRDEFGAAPLEETRGLYDQLRSITPPAPAWILSYYFQYPAQGLRMPVAQIPVEQLIQKLNQLQSTIDTTNAELQQIQRILSQALSGSLHS